jgi:hypothetical protein
VPVIQPTPPDPPAPTHGRLLVDANGEPAQVSRIVATEEIRPRFERDGRDGKIVDRHGLASTVEELCVTPCFVDLRQGAHTLVFTSTTDRHRTSMADVEVGPQPSVVRHAMGRRAPGAGSVFGLSLLIAGVGLLPLGVFFTSVGVSDGPNAFLPVGAVLTTLGLGGALLGAFNMDRDRAEFQPGATTQFPAP